MRRQMQMQIVAVHMQLVVPVGRQYQPDLLPLPDLNGGRAGDEPPLRDGQFKHLCKRQN